MKTKALASMDQILVAALPRWSTAAPSARERKDRRINNCRSRSRQTSDLNSGEFSYIRQLFLRRS